MAQHLAQSVGAHQVQVLWLHLEFVGFHLHRIFYAQRPGDEVALPGLRRLLRGNEASIYLLLQPRVVARDLRELARTQAVAARVAHVRRSS